jgi:hypothetical protein
MNAIPRKKKAETDIEEVNGPSYADYAGLADSALQGVTVAFLSQVFRMDSARVKRRLVNCPVKVTRRRGTKQVQHLYDLQTAASYLVEPNISPEEIIRKLSREDLPPAINTAYWDAQLKRQKWEENAGQLWRTETIRSAIGGMFQTIKFTVQLWADTIERQHGLTEEQRETLNGMTDTLQQEIYDSFVNNAKETMTGPQLAEMEKMLGTEQYRALLAHEGKLDFEDEDDDDDII